MNRVFTNSFINPHLSCRCYTTVLFMKHSYPGVFLCILIANLARAVCAAVINEQQFKSVKVCDKILSIQRERYFSTL